MLFFFWAAKAGFLSGFPGIESVPGPQLPQIEFLERINGMIFLKMKTIYSFMVCPKRGRVILCLFFDKLLSFVEENQKKYAEFDERFKSSPLLNKLLEKSKLNKEK